MVKSWSSILSSCSDFVIGDFVMSGLRLNIGLQKEQDMLKVNVNVVRGNVNHSQTCFYRLGWRDLPVLGPSAPSVLDVSLLDLWIHTQDERFMGV